MASLRTVRLVATAKAKKRHVLITLSPCQTTDLFRFFSSLVRYICSLHELCYGQSSAIFIFRYSQSAHFSQLVESKQTHAMN